MFTLEHILLTEKLLFKSLNYSEYEIQLEIKHVSLC